MKCYRCEFETLVLASLWPQERKQYAEAGIVMRLCTNCGLEQNHGGHDEQLEPYTAAKEAPAYQR